MQHVAVSVLSDAWREEARLYGGALQYVFDAGRIGFITEGSTDLLRDGSTGDGVMQGVGGLPLRADAGSQRFLGDGIVLRRTNPRLQGLQHGAVRCLLDALWQADRLRGSAIQYSFNGSRIRTITECGTDLLRDSCADCRILQAFCTLPLCGNAGSERFLGGAIALRGTDTRLQGLQHCTVSSLFDTLRQFAYLRRSTIQHCFDDGRVSLVTEGRTDLLRDGGTGNRVLQGVGFLPLRANAGSQRFLRGAVALRGADTRL